MFVFLSKLLPLLVYPLGLGCILLAAALIFRKRARLQTALLISVLLVLFLGGNRWIAISLARSLEWRYLPQQSIPTADVIVLLGGSTEPAYPPRSQVEVNSAADRVLYAAALYHAGKAPAILLSGGSIAWQDGDAPEEGGSPAADMAELLGRLGVPQEALWLETRSLNTYENALYSREILQEHAIERILLVTSALHMPRSVALFEKQGIEVIPAPADFTVTQQGWDNLFSGSLETRFISLLPNASSLSLTTNVLKEYIGILVYRLRGWL
jgi:uncharacterized SAM-binding protein YcdF (DUF218 family)